MDKNSEHNWLFSSNIIETRVSNKYCVYLKIKPQYIHLNKSYCHEALLKDIVFCILNFLNLLAHFY